MCCVCVRVYVYVYVYACSHVRMYSILCVHVFCVSENSVCVCVYMSMCVRECVRERKRHTEGQTQGHSSLDYMV